MAFLLLYLLWLVRESFRTRKSGVKEHERVCETGSGKLRNTGAGSRVQRSEREENLTKALDVRGQRKDCMHFVEMLSKG